MLFTAPAFFIAAPLTAYPSDLDLIGPTNPSNSDAQGGAFNTYAFTNIFPYILNNSDSGRFEPPAITAIPPTTLLSPGNITLAQDSYVRVYFLNSFDTQENNSLGLVTDGNTTLSPGDNSLLFPNASTSAGPGAPSDPNAPYAGLSSGDFVDVGLVSAGSELDFFLLVDGAGPQGTLFNLWSDPSLNPGGINQLHTVRFDGTPYHLLAWEDGPLADQDDDFDDVFAVVQIVPVPEPTTYLMMAAFLAIGLMAGRKKRAAAIQHKQ